MILLNMRPSLAAGDALHVRNTNIKQLRDHPARHAIRSQLANFAHLIIGQLCIAVLLALGNYIGVLLKGRALLCRHISHIVIMSPQKQMIGPNARMVIATMQNPEIPDR
jgi:hypothetical protein